MVDDGQRHQHCPAPRRHFVNVKRHPARQERHFRRDRRQILPRKLPQERKVKLAESVHLGDTAKAHDVGACFVHERRIGRTASEFQREICFHGSVNLARATVINIPAAVQQLPFQNVLDATPLELPIDFAAPVHEQDVIGAECAINDQLAAPMSIVFLLAKKIFLGPIDGL
jgi:hypothetical protein